MEIGIEIRLNEQEYQESAQEETLRQIRQRLNSNLDPDTMAIIFEGEPDLTVKLSKETLKAFSSHPIPSEEELVGIIAAVIRMPRFAIPLTKIFIEVMYKRPNNLETRNKKMKN